MILGNACDILMQSFFPVFCYQCLSILDSKYAMNVYLGKCISHISFCFAPMGQLRFCLFFYRPDVPTGLIESSYDNSSWDEEKTWSDDIIYYTVCGNHTEFMMKDFIIVP